jgi:hypothetical protein
MCQCHDANDEEPNLGPHLDYCVRVAASWYDITPKHYVRVMVQRGLDDAADHNPILREAFNHKR